MSPADQRQSLETLRRIDDLCDQYEAAWNRGEQPGIDDYLKQVEKDEQPFLLKALVALDLELQKSEALDSAEEKYIPFFEVDTEIISELIKAERRRRQSESESQSEVVEPSHEAELENSTLSSFAERYQIPEGDPGVLGRGGFGTVYKAVDTNLNRTVALKVPLRTTLESSESLERFMREARIAASLHHPGICPILDVEYERKHPIIVMKYVAGPTLKTIFERINAANQCLSIPQSVRLVRQLGEAIEYAHEQGVIHRDLKPANIIWDRDCLMPVVTDFGLARYWNTNASELTLANQGLGTAAYVAPEQARGQSRQYGHPVDVYSLGIIFYEALTNHRPFTGSSVEVVMQKSLEDPPPPSTYQSEIDSRLDAICLKAIARKSEDRYQTVQEFLDALAEYDTEDRFTIDNAFLKPVRERAAESDSIQGQGHPTAIVKSRTWKSIKNFRTAFVVCSLLFLVASSLLIPVPGMSWLNLVEEERIDSPAPKPVPTPEPTAALPARSLPELPPGVPSIAIAPGEKLFSCAGHDKQVQSLAYSPDGKYFASAGADQTVRVWGAMDGELIHLLKGHAGVVCKVVFSSDGKDLASGGADGKVLIWDVATGKIQRTLDDEAPYIACVAFSPDGKRLVTGNQGSGTFSVWDTTNGKRVARINADYSDVYDFKYSPDGRFLVGASWDSSIKIWDAATFKLLRSLKGHTRPARHVAISPDGQYIASSSNEAIIWDATTGERKLILREKIGTYSDVTFNSDGSRLAFYSHVWNVKTGQKLITLQGQKNVYFPQVAFSPDGQRLAFASWRNKHYEVAMFNVSSSDILIPVKNQAAPIESKRL